MKKLFTLAVAAMMAAGAMAQTWYLGGSASVGLAGGSDKNASALSFDLRLAPMAGYEFNDKWAIEFGGMLCPVVGYAKSTLPNGIAISNTESGFGGGVFVYGRYTAWNNGLLYIDLKFGDEFYGTTNSLQDMVVFIPQFRVRVHDHVDLGVTLGQAGLGVTSYGNNSNRFNYMLQAGAGVNCVYRF